MVKVKGEGVADSAEGDSARSGVTIGSAGSGVPVTSVFGTSQFCLELS